MARDNQPLQVFNRGRISRLGLGRTDLDRTRLSAEVQCNWIPRTLGSMTLRPGLEYIGTIRNSSTAILMPFVFSNEDTAIYEFTSTSMRAWVSDALVTRVGTTAAVTLGDFSSTLLGGWTDADDSGSTSEWVTGNYLGLTGTRYAVAQRYQSITSSAGTHTIEPVIKRGRVKFKVGSSADGDDYFEEVILRPGNYSFPVATTGNFFIQFGSNTEYRSLVESVSIDTSTGEMVLDTPWASSDLRNMRWDQSGDVVFVDCSDIKPRRIERYGSGQYGIAEYDPLDGPFRSPNTGNTRLTASDVSGEITLTSDQPLFQTGHAGALWRLTSIGQKVQVTPSGTDQWSDPIRVSGIENTRIFDILITTTSTYDATIRVQQSVGEVGSWIDVDSLVWTTTQDTTHDDGNDNQIIFYRIGVGSTYVSGSPTATLTYAGGGISGIARTHTIVSPTESSASVLINLGSTKATETWEEGEWSTKRGYPSALAFHEGRLFHAGKSKVIGSLPDAFDSFDPEQEGDSAVINRSIGSGPVDTSKWLVSLGSLIIGTDGREIQVKTSSLEEALTATNFNLKDVSTQGSANVQAVKIDKRLMFVQNAGQRIMESGYSGDSLTYETVDRSVLVPEIGDPEIVKMAVQRQPDTRIHCVRSATDGTVGMFVSDPAENVAAWLDVKVGETASTKSYVEDVAIVPSTGEDAVYYLIRRHVDSSWVRYLEKWGQETEARGGRQKSWGFVSGATSIVGTSDDSSAIDFLQLDDEGVSIVTVDFSVGLEPYKPTAAEFPGGSTGIDYQTTTLSLPANSQGGIVSFWGHSLDASQNGIFALKDTTSTAGSRNFFISAPGYMAVGVNQTTDFGVGTATFQSDVSIGDFSTGEWIHWLAGWDMTSGDGYLFRNGVPVVGNSKADVVVGSMDFTGFNVAELGVALATGNWNGRLSDLYINLDETLDFSSTENIDKFYNGDCPVFLGADGSKPTGTQPEFFFSGDFETWFENRGSAGTLAVETPGTLIESTFDNCPLVGSFDVDTDDGTIFVFSNSSDGGSTAIVSLSDGSSHTFNLRPGHVAPGSNGANKIADSNWAQHSTSLTRAVSGGDHLVGETVVVWGNDRDLGTYTVSTTGGLKNSTGGLTVSQASTSFYVGLAYDGWYKSAKLAFGSQAGTALTQKKRIPHVGLILADTHVKGIEYGQSSDELSPLPIIHAGAVISSNVVFQDFDEPSVAMKAQWDTDSRIILKASSPRPATVLAAVISVDEKDKL